MQYMFILQNLELLKMIGYCYVFSATSIRLLVSFQKQTRVTSSKEACSTSSDFLLLGRLGSEGRSIAYSEGATQL